MRFARVCHPAVSAESSKIVAEMYAAGYDLVRSDLGLPYQFILEFAVRPAVEIKLPSGQVGGDPD